MQRCMMFGGLLSITWPILNCYFNYEAAEDARWWHFLSFKQGENAHVFRIYTFCLVMNTTVLTMQNILFLTIAHVDICRRNVIMKLLS